MTRKICYCISLLALLTNTSVPIKGCLIARYVVIELQSVLYGLWRRIRDSRILLDLGKLKILSNLPKVTQLESSRTGTEAWTLTWSSVFLLYLVNIRIRYFSRAFWSRFSI